MLLEAKNKSRCDQLRSLFNFNDQLSINNKIRIDDYAPVVSVLP